MLFASFSFAWMTIFARLSAPHVPWAQVAAGRTAVGVLLAYGTARLRGQSLALQNPRAAWARSLFGTLSALCTFYVLGSPQMEVGDAATLSATAPIFIALLAPLILGESGGRRTWAAVLVSFAGVVVLAHPELKSAGHLVVVMLVAALSSGFAMVFLRRLGPRESPEAVVWHFSLVATVCLGLISLPSFAWPSGQGWALLLATGLAGGVGQLAQTRAYALAPAARLGALSYAGVVLTALLAHLVLGESLERSDLGGAALVIGGGLLLLAPLSPRGTAART